MSSQEQPGLRWVRAGAAMVLAATGAAGCGDADGSSGAVERPSTGAVDELGTHHGNPCPRQLPQGDVPDHGLGTDEPARAAPSLPSPDSAWVCQYQPFDVGPGPGGDGTTLGWKRVRAAGAVAPRRLADLGRGWRQLVPPEGERLCTADLGPRWMLVISDGGDLTGVVVDDYGCRDVRLTDEPFETVPGDASQQGTVGGFLVGPQPLLEDIKAAYGS